jgi:hypothetical protein
MAAQFALAPALVNPGQLIDYSTPGGAKIYTKATSSLADNGYDLSSADLKTFLSAFDDRIVESGWEEIFSIPEDPVAAPPILHMLTDDYGIITMEQINAHVTTYINNNNRDCQNAYQAFNCIMSSITDSAKKRINLKRTQFTINGIGCGPLLLKVIIQTAYVDTRSTVLHLREQLSQLDTYMIDVNSDIEQYNDHVKTLVDGLNARGEQTLDLLANLFKGYMGASDADFIDFIKRKKNSYEEGDIDLTAEQLMQATDNKYNSLKQSGRWNQTSEQDDKIIALQAQVSHLIAKTNKKKPTAGTSEIAGNTRERKTPLARAAWNDVAPKEGEPETKVVDGKTYYWCRHHQKWSLNPNHTTDSCKGHGVKATDELPPGHKKKDGSKAKDTPAIRLQSALMSVNSQEESDDDE